MTNSFFESGFGYGGERVGFVTQILQVADLKALDPVSRFSMEVLKKKYSDRQLFSLARKVSLLEEDPLSVKLDKLFGGELGLVVSRLPEAFKNEVGIVAEDTITTQIEKIKGYHGDFQIDHLDLSNLHITSIPVEILQCKIQSIDCSSTSLYLEDQKNLLAAAIANPNFKFNGFSQEVLLDVLEKNVSNPLIIKKILKIGFENRVLDSCIVALAFNNLKDDQLEFMLSDRIKSQKIANCSKASPLPAFKWYVYKYYLRKGLSERDAMVQAKKVGSFLSYHMRQMAIVEAENALDELDEKTKEEASIIIEKAKAKQPKRSPRLEIGD